ncbi:MAG: ATP-binding protein [Flavobacteriaceae bacterium]|nr:MAG: ATP-binding protein [Flavobacteriaceae bacterium]
MDIFKGTENYIASKDLSTAVNASIALQKPLLIKGEPGTGKTQLAFEIQKALGLDLFTWHVKSTTKAQQGLYEYDAVARLRDSQLGEEVSDLAHYIKKGPLWKAFESEKQTVLLIDEIDKADIEFPNDLLQELDKMEFYCYELQQTIKAKHRPIILISSNNEKELPDAFLRRCFFHYIQFPEPQTMREIVAVHHPKIEENLVEQAMEKFYELRNLQGLKKKPSTSELIDWIELLKLAGISSESLSKLDFFTQEIPFGGALIKNEQDQNLLKEQNKPYRY